MDLISLLIAIIILAVILYAVSILLNMIEIPPPMKQLVWLVIFVVILIIVLSWFSGGLSGVTIGGTRDPALR